MAMGVGGKQGGAMSQINMTPMIDVLLVLLIIFMVVQQGLQKGLSVQIPPVETEANKNLVQNVDQIVLEVRQDGFFLNSQPVAAADLTGRLQQVFADRNRKVIFVKGAEDISYNSVVQAVDAARAAGIEVVGLVPRTTEEGTPVS